ESTKSVFVTFLREAGVTLRRDGTPNEIAVDQVVFQKRLQQRLLKSPRYPEIVQEFTTGLESHIEDLEQFRNCLLPCAPPSSDAAVGSFHESVLRMLLGIEMLQTSVINTLLEKVPEFMLDSTADGGLSVPRVIINQLKWLDRVVDSKELAKKLMELVSVAPVEVQRDIITSLPEILDDSQHNDVAKELSTLLRENTQLTVPILDALSSLNLSASLLAEVREGVLVTLPAVKLEDLPVVVKFILHSVSASDAYEVVCNLRKKLELEQCVLPPVLLASQSRIRRGGSPTSDPARSAGSSQDNITLILDAIKSSVRFHKTISEAWLKAIESVTEVEDHKVIDLLVLYILHCTNANQSRRGAERVLKAKVRTGMIQEALLQRTFRDYAQVMRVYFPSILALAQSVLRSPDPCVVSFGGNMYLHSFAAFDSYCQQEVVGSLVTHVCCGVGGEVDTSLELLCGLVKEKPTEMAQHAVFVKGILDYMDNLTLQQIRRLFHLLSRLAFGPQQQGAHIQDDMHIVIRKQLSSTVSKYKRIGIIGAVRMVGSMGALRCRPKEDAQKGTLPPEMLRQVSALLELVKSSSESSPEAAALYYDELANLIVSTVLDPQVQETISQSVLHDFQDDFVVDLGPEITDTFPFPARVMYSLEEQESQDHIAINLLPLLAKETQHRGEQPSRTEKTHRRVSPLCLSPFFRLLRLCEEKQHNGDLDEIDGLVGCPLILTDMDVIEKIDSLSKTERDFICTLLFHTLNWFREVVNSFCQQEDIDVKMKVVTRLQNITYLQTLLEKALSGTPGFAPPVANFDGDSVDVSLAAAPVNKGKKEGVGKKRKAPGSSSQLEDTTIGDKTQQVNAQRSSRLYSQRLHTPDHGTSLLSHRASFRELDVEVLRMLQYGLLSRSLLDSEQQTNVRVEVCLGPAELVFLLEDMLRKLEFRLTAGPAKKAPFLKGRSDKSVGFSHLQQRSVKDVVSFTVKLLPTLCSHLENCHNYFQTLLSENGGVVDGPTTDPQEHQLMSSGYQLLLQILNTTFSWSGFSQPGHRSLMKMALGELAGRLKEGSAELTLDQLVKHSVEYLLNFRSTVPSLSTAVCLCQLLSTLSEKGGTPAAYREQMGSLAKHFLSQDWVAANGEKERGSKFNEALYSLLSIYLAHVNDVLKAVEEIAGEGIPQHLSASKDESSSSWPTLNKQTFLVFYKVLMAELEKTARKIPPWNSSDGIEAQTEKLLTWNLAVRDFHILVNLVKVFDSRPVLNVCLKYGRLFLESFLKLGMPILDNSFKRHKEDIQSLLKTFQLSTRQLHHMCGHSKIHQDTSLTNHVPALKKSLELFVYRVKAMLTLNNCQEAFWIGNLKNRNLKGEEILSQRSQESEDDEEDEAEQESLLPQDQAEDEALGSDSEESKKVNVEEDVDQDITDDSGS
uniref:FA complementation group D2 n=1 Tax=Tetraodon nigroviridis TaxID=99883 RepID=H3DAV5_TETNG